MDEQPRFQFGTRSLLLLITYIAISIGALIVANRRLDQSDTGVRFIDVVTGLSPWWLPFAFAGYAIGAKRIRLGWVVLFAVAEAIGLACFFRIALH